MTLSIELSDLDPLQFRVLQEMWTCFLPDIPLPEALKTLESTVFDNKLLKTFFFKSKMRKNLYLYGPVGCGKTTLMEMLYEHYPHSKCRYHFEKLCTELHYGLSQMDIKTFVKKHFKDIRLIWIDELQIYDITTAMLLKKLLPAMIAQKLSIISTGNVMPLQFYENGYNKKKFEDFIPYFCENFSCFSLAGITDYRLYGGKKPKLVKHFYEHTVSSYEEFFTAFQNTDPTITPSPYELPLNMRVWTLAQTLMNAVFLDFQELAKDNHHADDYYRLIEQFSIVFLYDVPKFTKENRDACRRFMVFIDVAYDQNAVLYMESKFFIDNLFEDDDSIIPFKRTKSRLHQLLNLNVLQFG